MHDIAFAVLRDHVSKVGQIMDISMSGLSFRYIVNGGSPDASFELDILLVGHGLCIEKVRFKKVSDFQIPNKSPFSPLLIRRCGVRFEELTLEQRSQLEDIIRKHALNDSDLSQPNSLGQGKKMFSA
jgi:hypothetical protein